jgi:DNA-binding FadR family transcriptional regulator
MIVGAELPDGVKLPGDEDLMTYFGVKSESLERALATLASEGLVSFHRSAAAPAVVRTPDSAVSAYAMGLVLEGRRTTFKDLGEVIALVEVECASRCARAPDRADRIIPELRRLNAAAGELLQDQQLYIQEDRKFHHALIALSASSTMAVVGGALRTVWTEQVNRMKPPGVDPDYSAEDCAMALKTHEVLTDAIAEGDIEKIHRVLGGHIRDVNEYWASASGTGLIDMSSEGLEGTRRSYRS